MTKTNIFYSEAAHGKSLWAKAELAVASALSETRHKSNMSKQVLAEVEGMNHLGSFFFTTDQLADNNADPEFKKEVTEDNIVRDIDVWGSSLYRDEEGNKELHGKRWGFSVKAQHMAAGTGNVVIELSLISTKHGWVKPGWFKTSQADFYSFVIGNKAVVVEKQKLEKLIEENNYRILERLSNKTFATNSGRCYDDSSSLLLPVKDFIGMSTVFTLPKWFDDAYKASTTIAKYDQMVKFWEKMGK